MECLKCGRETDGKDVFCKDCLAVMASSPIKPGTPVTLPRREAADRRSPLRKTPKPEELIAQLRRTIRRLWVGVAVLSVLLSLTAGSLAFLLYRVSTTPQIGQNYSTAAPDSTSGQ